MPNLEIPKLNIHPEPTPEQMQTILKEQERLEKTLLGIKSEIAKGNFKLQDNGLYSLEVEKNNIIEPNTDPLMQIVDPQGNPISSKIEKPADEVEEPEEIEEEVVDEVAEEEEEVAPTPVDPKQVELEQVVARIREYNKNNTPLSPEDLKYRRENWGKVEVALMDLHKKEKVANPEPEVAHNFIEHTGPNLERSRSDYVTAIFNNRNNTVVDPVNQEHLKNLQKKYNENIEAELTKVQPKNQEGGKLISVTQARLDFLQAERDQFNNEFFLLENEETKKRIGAALDKAFVKTGQVTGRVGEVTGTVVGKVGGLAGTAAGVVGEQVGRGAGAVGGLLNKGVDTILDRFNDKKKRKKGDGMPWWYYALAVPASVTGIGIVGGEILHKGVQDSIALLKKKFNQVVNPEKKKADLKEKFGAKKPGEKKEVAVPGEAMQQTQEQIDKEKKLKEIEARKDEFLEKAFGVKVEGNNLTKWNRLSNISIGAFFDPETMLNKKLETYTPWQRAIYDKLLPLYKKDTSPTKDKIVLKNYLTSLAEQDKLKDLWTQTSSSNS